MRPQVILTVISGDLKDKQVIFNQATSYTIGRAKNCNLCFSDSDLNSGISRYHCLLEIDPPRVYIRDLGSTNGTIVNGLLLGQTDLDDNYLSDPTSSRTIHPLKSGDEINIGETIVKIEIVPADAEPSIDTTDSTATTHKSSLKRLALKGVSWTIVGYGLTQSLRFVSNLVLTRLLTPDLFGLLGLANVIYIGVNLFSDFGINQNIIQNPRGEERSFLNTAWTIQVVRGICLWLICVILAFPAAIFFKEPRLQWLIPIVGFNAVIAGFNSTSLALLNRKVAVAKLTIIELSVYILQLIITIVWARISPTIWALIVGWLISTTAKAIVSHLLDRTHRDKLGWDKSAFREMFRFGSGVFFSTLCGFTAAQADKMILARELSIETLGIYVIAFTLADIPRQVIARISSSVIFPLVTKQVHLPREELRDKLAKPRSLFLLLSAISLALVSGFGDLFIWFAYDDRYDEAGWMLRILSLGLWQTLLYRTSGAILIAFGKIHYYAIGSFFTAIIILGCLPPLIHFKGLLSGVILIAFADVPQYFILNYALYKQRLNYIWQDAKFTLFYIVLVALTQSLRSFFFP